jgi:hypothetical protein
MGSWVKKIEISVFILAISFLQGCNHNKHTYDSTKQQYDNKKQNDISEIEKAKLQIVGAKDVTKEIINNFIKNHPVYDQFTDYKTEDKMNENFYKDKGVFRIVCSEEELRYSNMLEEWHLLGNSMGGETKTTGDTVGMTVMGVKFKYITRTGEYWAVRLKKYIVKMPPEEARKVQSIEAFGYIIDAKKEPNYREATLAIPMREATETNTVTIDPILLKINMKDNSSLFTLVKDNY